MLVTVQKAEIIEDMFRRLADMSGYDFHNLDVGDDAKSKVP